MVAHAQISEPPLAEVINVGTELIVGGTLNTHQQYLAEGLFSAGIPLYRISCIGDNATRLSSILGEALTRCNILLITGGLGPTADDITRRTVSCYLGLKEELNLPAYKYLQKKLIEKNALMNEAQKSQCYAPRGSKVFLNHKGTAPAIGLRINWAGEKKLIYLLPGPPNELAPLFEKSCLTDIRRIFGDTILNIKMKKIYFPSAREMTVASKIDDWLNSPWPKVAGIYAKPNGVQLTLMATGDKDKQCEQRIKEMESSIRKRFSKQTLILTEETHIALARVLSQRKISISFAESCTGGLATHTLTTIPGSSVYLKGSIIAYSQEIKKKALHVSSLALKTCGEVSSEVAIQMSTGCAKLFGTDLAISITGIAGPAGGSVEKPVGLVFFAVCYKATTKVTKVIFTGNRAQIQLKAASKAYELALLELRTVKSLAGS